MIVEAKEQIANGGKLDHSQIDGTAMMKRTLSNEKEAVSDIAVDSANAGNKFLNNVQENFNGAVKTSVDEFKVITGLSKKNPVMNYHRRHPITICHQLRKTNC